MDQAANKESQTEWKQVSGADPGFLERRVHMYKGVGVYLFFLKYSIS